MRVILRFCRVWAQLVVLSAVVALCASGLQPVNFGGAPATVFAANPNNGSDGNCNNWYPHGWSWQDVGGYTGGENLSGNLQLYEQYNGGWVTIIYGSNNQPQTGFQTDLSVDNYDGTTDQGSGWWQEYATHTGGGESGAHTVASIWCG